MKIETTVALSEDLVAALDSRSAGSQDRSAIVEAALRAYLTWPQLGEDAADLEVINSHATELNEEAADILEYQVSTPEDREQAVKRLLELSRRATSGSGGRRWTREELHER